jgi:acetyl esterase/lipase
MSEGPNAGSTIRRYALGAVALVALAIFSKGGALKQRILDKLHGASGRATEVVARTTASAPTGHYTLPGLRKSLKSKVGEGQRDDTPAPEPPPGVLEQVFYAAPLGRNVAYVTPVRPGARGPAIVWIVGGFGFGIDQGLWQAAPRDNDQTAAAFRKAGIAQLFPALRGASQNPGHHECFLGEVDDILAATDFLAQRPDVDPARIYLGGHSTGGTMVLLAAESSSRYRAVFAFGPVGDMRNYGSSSCVPASASAAELKARAPMEFLGEIVSPTFIIEGMQSGNGALFPYLRRKAGKADIHFVEVAGGTHFTTLAPGCDVIAKAILADNGPTPALDITAAAITGAMRAP